MISDRVFAVISFLIVCLIAVCLYMTATADTALRSSRVPAGWHAPRQWLLGAICIHEHESGNWHRYNPPYANGFQFTLGTWERAGGSAATWASAPVREQVYRAFVIWRGDGGSWREWPTSRRICHLG